MAAEMAVLALVRTVPEYGEAGAVLLPSPLSDLLKGLSQLNDSLFIRFARTLS